MWLVGASRYGRYVWPHHTSGAKHFIIIIKANFSGQDSLEKISKVGFHEFGRIATWGISIVLMVSLLIKLP